MPAERAAAPTTPAGAATAPAAPAAAFVMMGTDDAGLCVDGVCALPTPPTSDAV